MGDGCKTSSYGEMCNVSQYLYLNGTLTSEHYDKYETSCATVRAKRIGMSPLLEQHAFIKYTELLIHAIVTCKGKAAHIVTLFINLLPFIQ